MVRYRFTPDRHFPRHGEQGPDPDAVADAFAGVVRALMAEFAVSALVITGLEVRRDYLVEHANGQAVGPEQPGPPIHHLAREECWGGLESGGLGVQVGYDFHLVVATPRHCPDAEAIAQSVALFVESL